MAYDIMEVEILFDELNEKTEKTIASYRNDLMGLRAGRANPHILDKVVVDYYGNPTALNQMTNISVPEARLLVISVWDASAVKNVEKAIINANIGLTPSSDGKIIRLVFPEITEDRRKSLVKDVKAMCEKGKVGIRNIRRDILEELKKLKKDSVVSEDELASFEKDVEKIIVLQIAAIDKVTAEKEKEIMSV